MWPNNQKALVDIRETTKNIGGIDDNFVMGDFNGRCVVNRGSSNHVGDCDLDKKNGAGFRVYRPYCVHCYSLDYLGYILHNAIMGVFGMTTANWRDAKTIVPNNERLVLVVIDNYVLTGNYFVNGRVWLVNGEYENGRVTHWAEFPQPPTLEETDE